VIRYHRRGAFRQFGPLYELGVVIQLESRDDDRDEAAFGIEVRKG
jgi:hypothetical protein